MTIAHVAALYRRDAKRRRKHGVKCKRLVLAHSVNEWASTNQLKLFLWRMKMLKLSEINKITKVSKHLQQGKIDQAKANRDKLTRELARIQDALNQAQIELDKAIEEQQAFEKMLEELGV